MREHCFVHNSAGQKGSLCDRRISKKHLARECSVLRISSLTSGPSSKRLVAFLNKLLKLAETAAEDESDTAAQSSDHRNQKVTMNKLKTMLSVGQKPSLTSTLDARNNSLETTSSM